MRILHLISQRPESTGSGFYVQNIIRLARDAGHRNHLIAGVPEGYNRELGCIEKSNCSFVSFGGEVLYFSVPGMSDVMPYESTVFSEMSEKDIELYETAFSERIQEVVSDFCPDIIHSHHLWLATALARRTVSGITIVTSCHSTDLRQFHLCPHLGRRVLEDCRSVDRIMALSRDQSFHIQKTYNIDEQHIDIVGAGFDNELFSWQTNETTDTVYLLYAGKLSFSKGVDWLLRCMEQLANLPLHLHLAGSGTGEEEKRCLELAAKIPARVTVHGRLSQMELSTLMQRCHVFVLPSFYEGLPLVLLEALASGCRIVTTTLPGCLELLGEENADHVQFVELPQMQEVDRPDSKDLPLLDRRLREGLETMYWRVKTRPVPDKPTIMDIVQKHGWNEVYKRIEYSYFRALGMRSLK
jgi:glycosyltransferase involved in cell wall biosynthesis